MKLPAIKNLPFLKKEKPAEKQEKVGLTGIDELSRGMVSVQDVIAPGAIEVDFDFIKIGSKYFRTLFVAGYPRFVSANWLSSLINFDHSLDIAMYIYPVEGRGVLDDLRRKIAEMEARLD